MERKWANRPPPALLPSWVVRERFSPGRISTSGVASSVMDGEEGEWEEEDDDGTGQERTLDGRRGSAMMLPSWMGPVSGLLEKSGARIYVGMRDIVVFFCSTTYFLGRFVLTV